MISANTLNLLMAAGVSGDALVQVVQSIDNDMARTSERTARQERNARYYEAKRLKSVLKRLNQDAPPPVLNSDDERLKASESKTPLASARPLTTLVSLLSEEEEKQEKQGKQDIRQTAKKPISDFPSDAFEQWIAVYPRRTAKAEARKSFDRVKAKGLVTFAGLMAGTQRFARDPPDPQFTPHPATWLNQGRWDDEPTDQNRGALSRAFDKLDARIAERANLVRYDPALEFDLAPNPRLPSPLGRHG